MADVQGKAEGKVENKAQGKAEVKKESKTESKHDKFKRLATQRVSNAMKKIELIGNLSSSGYEYSPEEVDKVFSSLQQTLDATKARFSRSKKEETKKFVL